MKLEMIGVGPFIPHEKTKFGKNKNPFQPEVYFKTIAILRILNPKAHIPATTAFDAIQKNGRDLVLQRGANVFMPNCTPKKYRENYQLYPGKPCLGESSEQCFVCVKSRIKRIGRIIGTGRGDAFK
jgi:biotin synthase